MRAKRIALEGKIIGYQTDYNLTMPRNPITPEQLAAWIESDDEAKYSLDSDGSCSGNDSRWYEHDKSMIALSAKYPTTIFKLHGDGEGSGDIWDKYYVGGKLQHEERLKAELPVPDLDAWVPKPDFAKRRSRIAALLIGSQAAEGTGVLQEDAARYLAIESAEIGGFDEKLFAMGAETIPDITQQINESETERDNVTVYDLDTGEILTPIFIVAYYGVTDGDGKNYRKIDVNGIDL